MKIRRWGFALITVLMVVTILAMMATALSVAVRGQFHLTLGDRERCLALQTAEAGLAHALAELEDAPNWPGWTTPQLLDSGNYQVRFQSNPSGPFTDRDSVNNLDGLHPNSYRGNLTVPSGYALVIVVAKVGSSERVLEALVGRGVGPQVFSAPLVSSGRIALQGNVKIDGVHSLSTPGNVAAGIHSNLNSAAPNLISYSPSGGAIDISGGVTSSGTNAGAINLSGYTPLGGITTNAPQRATPSVDILAAVDSKSTATAPTLVTGLNLLNSGDYYLNGDTEIQGDLELNGAKLYVKGSLKVNGTIRGSGSVYATGNTSLQGDSQITGDLNDQVALFSHGHIQLTGFDGTDYLNNLTQSLPATDPNRLAWSQAQDSLRDFQNEINSPAPQLNQDGLLDRMRAELGQAAATRTGRTPDSLGQVLTLVNSQSPSPTRDFLVKRLNSLRDSFMMTSASGPDGLAALALLAQGKTGYGVFDTVIDSAPLNNGYIPNLAAFANQMDANHLGSSKFQGILFSHGSIYASNEVTVLGAVVAHSDGSQVPVTIGNHTLQPGDVHLSRGSKLTYVEDFFSAASAANATGPMARFLWMSR